MDCTQITLWILCVSDIDLLLFGLLGLVILLSFVPAAKHRTPKPNIFKEPEE